MNTFFKPAGLRSLFRFPICIYFVGLLAQFLYFKVVCPKLSTIISAENEQGILFLTSFWNAL